MTLLRDVVVVHGRRAVVLRALESDARTHAAAHRGPVVSLVRDLPGEHGGVEAGEHARVRAVENDEIESRDVRRVLLHVGKP